MLLHIIEQLCSVAYSLFKSYLIYVLLIVCWKLCESIKNHVVSKIWKVDLKANYGSWAVITGCTDGIGKAYSYELAKRGINLILVSRTLSKLEAVASDLRNKYAIETEIIQVDFSKGIEIQEDLERKLHGRSIAILVNNVGVSLGTPKSFDYVTKKVVSDHITVNIMASTYLINVILPSMISNRRGAIINIASMASMHPSPYSGIYSASKAYNYYFSEALKTELQDKGIFVQTVMPSYVATSMNNMVVNQSLPSLLVPTPEDFAADAVSTIGYTNFTCGCFAHDMLAIVFYIFPQWLLISISVRMRRYWMKNLRQN